MAAKLSITSATLPIDLSIYVGKCQLNSGLISNVANVLQRLTAVRQTIISLPLQAA